MELLSRRHLFVLAALAGLVLLHIFTPNPTFAGETEVEMEKLRTMFIKRMAKYVSWPPNKSSGPIVIAATDARSLAPYFDASKTGQKRKFILRQWPVDQCDILFLNNVSSRTAAAIIRKVDSDPILTIGQAPELPAMGGMINFIESEGRLRLQINPEAVRKAGLHISSRLMSLANIYRGSTKEFKSIPRNKPSGTFPDIPGENRRSGGSLF